MLGVGQQKITSAQEHFNSILFVSSYAYLNKIRGYETSYLDPNTLPLDNWISNNNTDINKQLKKVT